jgi:hypothetical protein
MDVPLMPGVQLLEECPFELLMNVYWRASMSVTGQNGFLKENDNLLNTKRSLKCMIRLPPTCDYFKAKKSIQEILSAKNINFKSIESIPGFCGSLDNPLTR